MTTSSRPRTGLGRWPISSTDGANSSCTTSCSAPTGDEGCPSCSFWADNFNGVGIHMAHRDVTFVVASRAPLDRLLEYRARMGWTFPWVSNLDTDFNED